MELSKYIKKYVKIELKQGFFYVGTVLGVNDGFLSIKDRNGKLVDISIDAIMFIKEVEP